MKKPNIIAHRGGDRLAPENSQSALERAARLPVMAIEIDFRLTKDQQLVACHDATLKRLAGKPIRVDSLTLKELEQFPLISGEHLISFDKALDSTGDTPLILDVKGSGWVNVLANKLKGSANLERMSVLAFNARELAEFKKLFPDMKAYTAVLANPFKAIAQAQMFGFSGICIPFWSLSPLIYLWAKRNKLDIGIYTVNSVFLTKLLARWYPGIIITTDIPDKLTKGV